MDHILLIEFKEARRSCGRSQASLAAMLDVKPQMIKRLEAGVGSVPMLVEAMAALDFQLIGIGPGRTLGDQLQGCRLKKPFLWKQWRNELGCHGRPLQALSMDVAPCAVCCA